MRKIFISILTFVSIFSLISCQQKKNDSLNLFPASKGKIIATFDGVKITDQYMKAYLDQINPYLKSRYNTPEKKQELIKRILEGELLARYAIKEGVAKNPVLLTKLKATIARYYAGQFLKSKLEKNVNVTDKDAKKYYEEHKKDYIQPEKVRVSHILIKIPKNAKDKEKAFATAKKKAEKVLAELKKNEKTPNEFSKLVKKYSDDEGSKKMGGDVGFFARSEEGGRMVKPFSKAAFQLKKIGDISGLVKTMFGWHIIKLTGKKAKTEKSFESVKRQIIYTLKSQKRKNGFKDIMADIEKKLNYKVDLNAIANIDFNIPQNIKKQSEKMTKQFNQMKSPEQQKKIRELIKNLKNLKKMKKPVKNK